MRGPMKNQLTRRIIKNVEKEKRISKNATRLGLRSTDLQIYTQCNLLWCSSTHGACNTSLLHLSGASATRTSKQLQRNVAPLRIRIWIPAGRAAITAANGSLYER